MAARSPRSTHRSGWLVIAAALAWCLPACTLASCETEAFSRAVVAAVRAPEFPDPGGAGIAACMPLVRYDAVDYVVNQIEWDIPDAALTEVGQASGANAAAGEIPDRRVFIVDGIDPRDAIAMRIGPADGAVLLMREFGQMPVAACELAAEPVADCRVPGSSG